MFEFSPQTTDDEQDSTPVTPSLYGSHTEQVPYVITDASQHEVQGSDREQFHQFEG
ncbi:hypothetical protein KC973_03670 [Candidatus Saccharibacteria bacterium]|nr:hypothetical protein [Candidatus Saccharibacteria bacterium]